MRALAGGPAIAAALSAVLLLPAAAHAALPQRAAHFEIADHRVKGAAWHVEIDVARHARARLHTVLVYDEGCDEIVAGEGVPVARDGTFATGGPFTATNKKGKDQPGTWEMHGRFVTSHRVEGTLRVSEPGCEASRSYAGSDAQQHHDHGKLGYPNLANATPAARAQARRMLRRVRAVAARRFPTIQRARAAGFDRYMATDKIPEPGVFHLWSRQYNADGRVLDPARPESLVYWKSPRAGIAPKLVAFMFRVMPSARPKFAGSIPVWHVHKEGGDRMIHVWLTTGLRAGYANCLPVPELERTLHPFTFEDVRYDGPEAQPCQQ